VIPQPASRPIIALAVVVVFLAVFAIFPYKLGLGRFFESLFYFSATWIVMLMLAPPIAFFIWLAFLPRSFLPRIEISRTRICVVPGRMARFFAEAPVGIDLTPFSREILLCHSVRPGLEVGFRLVVRAADGTERGLDANSMNYLNARGSQELAEGISAVTGMPVRLLERVRQNDGTVQEKPWSPPPTSSMIVVGIALIAGVLPFAAGGVIGAIWPTPLIIVAVGLGLWLIQMSVPCLLARWTGSKAIFPSALSLTTVFTFSASYCLAVVVFHFICMGR
jgi:hypothetical protein